MDGFLACVLRGWGSLSWMNEDGGLPGLFWQSISHRLDARVRLRPAADRVERLNGFPRWGHNGKLAIDL
jgi:hypothetical protein